MSEQEVIVKFIGVDAGLSEKTRTAVSELRNLSSDGDKSAARLKTLNRELGITNTRIEGVVKVAKSSRGELAKVGAEANKAERALGSAIRTGSGTKAKPTQPKLARAGKVKSDEYDNNQAALAYVKGKSKSNRRSSEQDLFESTDSTDPPLKKGGQSLTGLAKGSIGSGIKIKPENFFSLRREAQQQIEALKLKRQDQGIGQQQGFSDAQRREQQQFDDRRLAKQQAFQDDQRSKDQTFRDNQKADEQAFQQAQQSEALRFKVSQKADELTFQQQQEADALTFQQQRQADRQTFDAQQQEAQLAFDTTQRAEKQAFNEAERARDAQAKAGFDARQQGIDRKLKLEFAETPEERAKLEAQYKREDEIAKRRAVLEKQLRADEAAYDAAKQQRELAFKAAQDAQAQAFREAQAAKELAFKAEQQAADLAFKQEQQAADLAFKAEQQLADAAFKAEQQLAEAAFKAGQQAEERRFKAEQQLADRTFQAEQQAADRAFQAEQRNDERIFRAQQRQLDRENAQTIAAILKPFNMRDATYTDLNPGKRYAGGAMTAGLPYWVGEGAGGKILPTSEIIVPDTQSYAVAAHQAQTWLRQTSGGNTNADLLAEVRELRAAITSRDPRVELQAVFPPSDSSQMDKYLRTQRAIIRSMM